MGTDGPAVGMGGHHGPPGKTHHVPEARIRQMGHIHVDGQLLHPLQEVPAISGQSLLRLLGIGAGETVGVVPHRVQQPHAPVIGSIQPPDVAVQQLGALDAQQRRRLALPHGLVHLRPGAAGEDALPVLLHLPQEPLMEQNALLRHGAALRHQPGTLIQGKKLGIAGKAPGPLQIDVSAAAAQVTCGVVEGPQLRVPEERPRRVAAVDGVAVCVKIGNRMYHLKMRFRCILCGWRRGSAPRRYRPLPRRSGRGSPAPFPSDRKPPSCGCAPAWRW